MFSVLYRWSAFLSIFASLIMSAIVQAQPQATMPLPNVIGPYPVATFEESLVDSSRNRTMDVLFFYPETKADGGVQSAPLVVFNHGFLLRGEYYRSYGEHLASHGFVVALPTFPMSFLSVHHVELARDVRFVIDHCLDANEDPGYDLFGRIDPERIGVAGHSLGGKLSLLAAVDDDRIRVAALLDPVDTGNPLFKDEEKWPSVAPERMPDLHIPLLFIGAELGREVVFFSACAPEDDNYERFFEAANPPAIEVTQLDVGHSQYVDEGAANNVTSSCAVGDVEDQWVSATSRAWITAFFLGHLFGEEDALAWLDLQLEEEAAAETIRVRRK